MKRLVALFVSATLALGTACTKDEKPQDSKHVAPDPSQWIRELGGQNPVAESAALKVQTDAAAEALPAPSGAPSASAAASAAPSGSAAPRPPQSAHAGADSIKVVEPGAEPRRKLRYKWKVGQPETMVTTSKRLVSVEADGKKQPGMPSPATKMVITIDPKTIGEGGELSYAFTIDAIELTSDGLPPQALAGIKKELDALKGTQGQGVMSSRGIVKDSAIQIAAKPRSDVGAQLLEQVKVAVRDLVPPLPAEDVGRGAKWERVTNLSGRITHSQKELFTLKESLGDQLTLDVVNTQSAPPQPFEGGPQGANLRLESLAGRATGTSMIDLNKLVPRSELHGTTNTTLVAEAEGREQKIKTVETIDGKVEPKK